MVFLRIRRKPQYKYNKKCIKYIFMPWIMSQLWWNFWSSLNYWICLMFYIFFCFNYWNVHQKNNKHAKKQYGKTHTIFFTHIVAPKIQTELCFLYILTKSNAFITHSSARYPNPNGNKLYILTLQRMPLTIWVKTNWESVSIWFFSHVCYIYGEHFNIFKFFSW